MEELIILGIIAFFGYRFIKPIFDAIGEASKQQFESGKVHDPQQMINMICKGLNPAQAARKSRDALWMQTESFLRKTNGVDSCS